MTEFQLSILASDRVVYEGPGVSLTVPTVEGQLGILAGHSNLIAAIVTGVIKYRITPEDEQVLAVSEGMVRVSNNEVHVLVDTAERPEEIDVSRARRAEEAAREVILQKHGMEEYKLATADLARALNRLKIKDKKYD